MSRSVAAVCLAIVAKTGKVCGKSCEGPVCGIHKRAHARDNPSEKLLPVNTIDAVNAVKIMDRMRANPTLVHRAFRKMIRSRIVFDPSINENKFATGGIAEHATVDLVNEVGYPAKNVASTETVIDMVVAVDDYPGKYSLKNIGDIKQAVILENFRGKTRPDIRPLPPTFLIYTEIPIKRVRYVYIDHEILKQAYPNLTEQQMNDIVYIMGDSNISIRSGVLAGLIPRLPDDYIVNSEFPELSALERKTMSEIAYAYINMLDAASENESA